MQAHKSVWQIRLKVLFVFICLGLGVQSVFACEGIKPLEKIYCQLEAKGQGASLPRFDEFQRNPELTQRLLLKRPAAKAGLQLPPDTSPLKSVAAKAAPSTSPAAVKPRTTQGSQPAPPKDFVKQSPFANAGDFQRCHMRPTMIQCDATSYQLKDNLGNPSLAANALTDANQLVLKPVPASSANIHDYLREAYGVYLQKMMAIGLAGVTLTYSKFYYIYEDVTANKKDFAARFKEMYVYLKKDKATMAVGRQHANKTPPELGQCDFLDANVIVCDNEGSNWMYTR